jgi:hypothetical protein
VLEKDKIMVSTKMVLRLINKMAARVHRPLKLIEFNASVIWRRRCELSEQLEDLHVDVALVSGSLSQIIIFVGLSAPREEKYSP